MKLALNLPFPPLSNIFFPFPASGSIFRLPAARLPGDTIGYCDYLEYTC